MGQHQLFTWIGEVDAICESIAVGEETAPLLRRMYHLLLNAPPDVRDALHLEIASETLEGWLNASAYREVALSLLGRAGYMMSRSSDGSVKATVIAGNVITESIAEGENEEQAICCALVGGLIDWSKRAQVQVSVCAH